MQRESKRMDCENCSHETICEKFDFVRKSGWLCSVCSHTIAGNIYFYPENCPDPGLYRMIAQCTNLIIEEIKNNAA